MKYLSLFSGIGGFELGINQAFRHTTRVQPRRQMDVLQPDGDSTNSDISLRNGRRSRPICIGYSEIDKYAIQVYEKHFKHKNYGDARVSGNAGVDGDLKLKAGFFFGVRQKGEEIKYVQTGDSPDIELIYKGDAVFGAEEQEKETTKIGDIEYDKAEVEERLKGIRPVN